MVSAHTCHEVRAGQRRRNHRETCAGDHLVASRPATWSRSWMSTANRLALGRLRFRCACPCAYHGWYRPSGFRFRAISRYTDWYDFPIRAAITLTRSPAPRPSAISTRSSWDRNRALIGFSIMVTLPASMNHSEPQLNDTPTSRAASAPELPARITSKYRALASADVLFHAR